MSKLHLRLLSHCQSLCCTFHECTSQRETLQTHAQVVEANGIAEKNVDQIQRMNFQSIANLCLIIQHFYFPRTKNSKIITKFIIHKIMHFTRLLWMYFPLSAHTRIPNSNLQITICITYFTYKNKQRIHGKSLIKIYIY